MKEMARGRKISALENFSRWERSAMRAMISPSSTLKPVPKTSQRRLLRKAVSMTRSVNT